MIRKLLTLFTFLILVSVQTYGVVCSLDCEFQKINGKDFSGKTVDKMEKDHSCCQGTKDNKGKKEKKNKCHEEVSAQNHFIGFENLPAVEKDLSQKNTLYFVKPTASIETKKYTPYLPRYSEGDGFLRHKSHLSLYLIKEQFLN